jgi:FtsZ-binding cell division protein ZapB
VALSRVRTLEGISLVGFNNDSLMVDPAILEFDQDLKNQSFNNELLFKKLSDTEQNKLEEDFINKMGGNIKIGTKKNIKTKIKDTKIPSIQITKELLDSGKNIKTIAKERGLVFGTIVSHIEELKEIDKNINLKHIEQPTKKNLELVRKANNQLKGDDKGKLSPLKTILDKEGANLSFEEIRIAKLFI